MRKPAILGGEPERKTAFPAYRTIGAEEGQAVTDVLDDGVLSQFLGNWSPDFLRRPSRQKLEREWAHYGVKHAVTMNSATPAFTLPSERRAPGP